MAFPVFLDTCTLFGQALTDLLLSLAAQGCFEPYWSREVLDAMERNVVQRGRANADAIHRRRLQMEKAFPAALVEGFEPLIGSMMNDPGDRHVLAACVKSPAQTLVTFNVSDFAAASVVPFDIEVLDPDDFVLDLLDLHPIWSRQAIEAMLLRNQWPPQDFASLASALERIDMPKTAASLRSLASSEFPEGTGS